MLSPGPSARKDYSAEDPSSPSWKNHRKHIFILSSAGKPIFSRYGDESKLAPLAGMLQALISFVHDTGDDIHHFVAGKNRVVFVTRGSLHLVCINCSGESVPYIARQLNFLHAQIISILTGKVEKIFQRNASFDLRGLLGGTDRVLRSLIREGSGEPTMLLQATPCLRMPAATRAELGRLLAATRPTALLFGVLLARGCLVQLLRPKKTPLHQHDLLLIMNTVNSSASFREDETWLPVCLPSFNEMAMLFAHVSFVAPELCLVLLTTQSDAFEPLSLCRQQVCPRRLPPAAAAASSAAAARSAAADSSTYTTTSVSSTSSTSSPTVSSSTHLLHLRLLVRRLPRRWCSGCRRRRSCAGRSSARWRSRSTTSRRWAPPRSATSSTTSPRTTSSPRRAPARTRARSARTATGLR